MHKNHFLSHVILILLLPLGSLVKAQQYTPLDCIEPYLLRWDQTPMTSYEYDWLPAGAITNTFSNIDSSDFDMTITFTGETGTFFNWNNVGSQTTPSVDNNNGEDNLELFTSGFSSSTGITMTFSFSRPLNEFGFIMKHINSNGVNGDLLTISGTTTLGATLIPTFNPSSTPSYTVNTITGVIDANASSTSGDDDELGINFESDDGITTISIHWQDCSVCTVGALHGIMMGDFAFCRNPCVLPDFADTDGDGLNDVCDMDDDNDGIYDSYEVCNVAPAQELFDTVTVLINTDNYPTETSWDITNSKGIVISSISAGDLTSSSTIYSWNVLVSAHKNYTFNIYDTYGDALSVGGGYYNVSVNGLSITGGNVTTNWGSSNMHSIIASQPPYVSHFNCVGSDPAGDDDKDGVVNYQDADYCILNANGACISLDSDSDGIPDFLDLDSDNDGCYDSEEENVPDPDNDGIAGTGVPAVDTNGLVTSITYTSPPRNYWQTDQIVPCLDCPGGILTNWNFETGWTAWSNWGNTTVTEQALEPDSAMLISGGAGGFGQQILSVVPGKTYSFTYYAKKSGSEDAYAGIDFKDIVNNSIQNFSHLIFDTIYRYNEYKITIPANSSRLEVYGWKNAGSDSAFYDAFCLIEVNDICGSGGENDNDGDSVCDRFDLDDDNDGIPDLEESRCLGNSQSLLMWHHNTLPDRDAEIYQSSYISNASQEIYGTGLGAYLEATLVKMTGVDQVDLAGAISDNDYLEYSFTTHSSINALYLDRFSTTAHGLASAATSDNYGYDFSILISEDNFVSSTIIEDVYTMDENIDPAWEVYFQEPDDNYFFLKPNTTYTFRVYFYNKTSDPTIEAWYDDFQVIAQLCEKPLDQDGDGVPNSLDLDSDNDGILDSHEAGHAAIDADANGVIDNSDTGSGNNGLYDGVETTPETGELNYTISDSESTPDNMNDPYELDSDGDGCFDVDEEIIGDGDDDGIAGTGTPSVDNDGLVTSITYATPSLHYWQDPNILGCQEVCYDMVDNDEDGFIDCLDEECLAIISYDQSCSSDTSFMINISSGDMPYSYYWDDWVQPESHWTFEDTTLDVSGNNHHEQIAQRIGAPAFDSDAIQGRYALSLDGATYLRYSVNNNFMEVAFTDWAVAFWIKPSTLTGTQYLFDEGGSSNGIALRLNGNILEFAARDQSVQVNAGSHTFPNDGNWHHVAAIYSNDRIVLYLDGTPGATSYTGYPGGEISNHSGNGGIGRLDGGSGFGGGSGSFYTGLMDDFYYFVNEVPSENQLIGMAFNDGNRYNVNRSGLYSSTITTASGCTSRDSLLFRCGATITTNLFIPAKVINK